MSDISDAIDQARLTWAKKSSHDLENLRLEAKNVPATRSLTEALSEDVLGLIVEPKRATMTRGVFNPSLDVYAVVQECEQAGATAVSVVSETKLSGGSIEDIAAARKGCSLPIIARDFIVDVTQVYALRVAGADAILTPASIYKNRGPSLDESAQSDSPPSDSFVAIVDAAHSLGMEVILSIQEESELAFALNTDVDILNIDNRDQFGSVDSERTLELLTDVPAGWPVISESIEALDQVVRLHHAGVDALLLDEGHLETGFTSALAVYADIVSDQ